MPMAIQRSTYIEGPWSIQSTNKQTNPLRSEIVTPSKTLLALLLHTNKERKVKGTDLPHNYSTKQ